MRTDRIFRIVASEVKFLHLWKENDAKTIFQRAFALWLTMPRYRLLDVAPDIGCVVPVQVDDLLASVHLGALCAFCFVLESGSRVIFSVEAIVAFAEGGDSVQVLLVG
jgi:hypothetical protein